MRKFIKLSKLLFVCTISLPVFSFLVSGCHTGSNPSTVAQATAKKEKAERLTGGQPHKSTKDQTKTIAETKTEKGQNCPVSFSHHENSEKHEMAQRNPFTLPALLQEQQGIPTYNQRITDSGVFLNSRTRTNHNNQQTKLAPRQNKSIEPVVSPYAPEPCVAGIFNNSKEKFALVRWHQVQGIFRCGVHLGNGYYVKDITANSVLLCPGQNRSGADTVRLIL